MNAWATVARERLHQGMSNEWVSERLRDATSEAYSEVRCDERLMWAEFVRSVPGSEEWMVDGRPLADLLDPNKSPALQVTRKRLEVK